MTGEEWALAASVFFSGLAAGFLGALCTIIRPMQAAMDGRTFRNFMEEFLRYADHGLGQVYNLAWAFVPVPGAVVALVLLWDDPGSRSRAAVRRTAPGSQPSLTRTAVRSGHLTAQGLLSEQTQAP